MDFDAVRLDDLKARIIEIEDFDKVDEELMSEINSNDELHRLFEEMKSLSALVADSTPTPTHNGVTLHEAVMKRVENGDTSPRYINTGRRFPLATAVCLLLCFAVVLVARSGIMGRFAAKNEADMAPNEPNEPNERMLYGDYSDAESKIEAQDAELGLGSLDNYSLADEDYEYFLFSDTLSGDIADSSSVNGALSYSKAPEMQAEREIVIDRSESIKAKKDIQGAETDTARKGDTAFFMPNGVSSGSAGAASGGGSTSSTTDGTPDFYAAAVSEEKEMTESEEEAVTEAVEPLFVYDGEEYTLSEVFEMYKNGTLTFDINADTYDEVWQACLERFARCTAEDKLELSEFVSENYKKSLE